MSPNGINFLMTLATIYMVYWIISMHHHVKKISRSLEKLVDGEPDQDEYPEETEKDQL